MKKDIMKKFDRKKQLMVSPLALAVSACGGGETSEVNDETSSDLVNNDNLISTNYTEALDFSSVSNGLEVPSTSTQVLERLQQQYDTSEYFYAVMGSPNVIHMPNEEDSDIVLIPSWYAYEPFLPAVSLTKDDTNTLALGQFDEAATIGWARNWAEIVVDGKTMVVIADTGHELATGYNTWKFGDVWLADFSGGGEFALTPISGENAFYHDIDVGDIDGDGLDDILAIHMGIKDGDPNPLHVFFQQEDGSFDQQIGFMDFSSELPELGGAAGALVDLNGDGQLEIIQTAYVQGDFPNWDMDHQFRVYGRDANGDFALQFSAPRSGEAARYGSSNVYDADIDMDGDADLILYMEGGGMQGIQIWENKGNFNFFEVTDDWLNIGIWSNQEFSNRDFSIADLNGDGFLDIFFNGFGPNNYQEYGTLNLGAYIFLNNNGENFVHLMDEDGLIIEADDGKEVAHSRFYHSNENSFEVFLINHDNSFGLVEISYSAFDGIIA